MDRYIRKPGGGRKPSKPEYSAAKNLTQQMEAAVDLYTDKTSLQAIADALSLNLIKVRKLLITAGVYESDTAKLVQQTFNGFRETQSYSAAVTSTMSVFAGTVQCRKEATGGNTPIGTDASAAFHL